MFFKIYKQNALTNKPDSMSKVVYVEILNKNNQTIAQQKLHTINWQLNNVINLPDTISTGNYILRAYTNWMKNFSTELFAYQSISVINPFKPIAHNQQKIYDPIVDSVVFYPESGLLVQNINTKLVFKVFDKQQCTISNQKYL